jgi:NlpC/P60 family
MPSANAFLDALQRAIGDPYSFGAAGPNSFDCSGLVYWAARLVGLKNFPRTSEEQWAATQRIGVNQLRPGDLIFEQWPGDQAAPGHVVIWMGGGKIEQAPSTGQLVQVDSFSPGGVSREGGRVVGYGRIPGLTGTGSALPPGGGSSSSGSSGATPAQLTAFLSAPSGVLKDAGALVHGTAVVLDRVFGLFAPGQGWRITFGAAALILLYLSYRSFGGGL